MCGRAERADMGIAATLGAAMWAFVVLGVVAAGACYWVVPWERFVDAEAAPEGLDVVWYTRVGMTAAAASLVPLAAGGWLTVAGTMAGVATRAGAAEPTLLERAAVVLPGQFVFAGSAVAGLLAAFLPVWVGAWVVAKRRLGGRIDDA